MPKNSKFNEDKLYNKILLLSRNKFFYAKLALYDTFQNRINLIFMHIAFIFINMREKNDNIFYKECSQKLFDLTFHKIELNMRELGYGDTQVNKNMKSLVKNFYNILLVFENYKSKTQTDKKKIFNNYLDLNKVDKTSEYIGLIEYFDRYQSFCLDLSSDNVLKGELNFINKYI
tara:strand:- start:1 stop:522 length:522 start_codon:yes stop_codon:yes gene_type:complete